MTAPDERPSEEPPEAPSGIRKLVGLVLLILLVGGALFLWNKVQHMGAVQDCVATGRKDCS